MLMYLIAMLMTTISISRDTKERLEARGRKSDTYEDIVVAMLDQLEKVERG